MMWLWAGGVIMVLTAIIHCFVGERRLITPLLEIDHRLTTELLPRQLIRFAWHFTGALMLISAALVVWPGVPTPLIIATGAIWLISGLADLVLTRGQHIGWPMLTLAGAFTLIGSM